MFGHTRVILLYIYFIPLHMYITCKNKKHHEAADYCERAVYLYVTVKSTYMVIVCVLQMSKDNIILMQSIKSRNKIKRNSM